MNDSDIIAVVRQSRKLMTIFDSIGFPAKSFYEDKELTKLIPDGLPSKIINVASEIHIMLQNIERSPQYQRAVRNLNVMKIGEQDG